jgi:hypothetical protein
MYVKQIVDVYLIGLLTAAVAEISLIKKASNPMGYVLDKEEGPFGITQIDDKLPREVGRKLNQLSKVKGEVFVRAANEYAAYVTLMLEDLSKTSDGDLQRIVKKCLWEGEIEREVVDGHSKIETFHH